MEVKITDDGSRTIYSERFNQHYHSVYGAKTESERVFIELGFEFAAQKFEKIQILELGFGTGLNAYLTKIISEEKQINTIYTGIEAFPLDQTVIEQLPVEIQQLHILPHNQWNSLHQYMDFRLIISKMEDFETDQKFNLIYFDAFDPVSQPELWSTQIFEKLHQMMENNAILTTYCSKSLVQKNLKNAGFEIEKNAGPPRKREVLRATRK